MIKGLLEFTLSVFFAIFFLLKRQKKVSPKIEKIIRLYQSGGFAETFAKIRIWDAPFESIEKIVARKGLVVDLGCGDGVITNHLALSGVGRKVIGIDFNPLRAKEAAKGIENVTILQGDILKIDFPQADTILLVHVLHHLSSYGQQAELINRCFFKLKNGGSLIIVEIKERPLLKFILTWLVDVFVFPILFEDRLLNSRVFYRSEKGWKSFLKNAGFTVKAISASSHKPFSHLLLHCKIKAM